MTDAAHLLSDASGFALSLFAMWVSTRRSAASHSFGYHRAEVLGALASIICLWAVTIQLIVAAVGRLLNPPAVNGKLMSILAVGGLYAHGRSDALQHKRLLDSHFFIVFSS